MFELKEDRVKLGIMQIIEILSLALIFVFFVAIPAYNENVMFGKNPHMAVEINVKYFLQPLNSESLPYLVITILTYIVFLLVAFMAFFDWRKNLEEMKFSWVIGFFSLGLSLLLIPISLWSFVDIIILLDLILIGFSIMFCVKHFFDKLKAKIFNIHIVKTVISLFIAFASMYIYRYILFFLIWKPRILGHGEAQTSIGVIVYFISFVTGIIVFLILLFSRKGVIK